MVFLRKVETAPGATAVQIAERKNRRDVDLEHLGSAHTDAELAALMTAGRAKINAGQEVLDLGLSKDPQGAVVHSKRPRLLHRRLRRTQRDQDASEDWEAANLSQAVRAYSHDHAEPGAPWLPFARAPSPSSPLAPGECARRCHPGWSCRS